MADMGQEQHAGLARVDRAAVLRAIGSELVHAGLKLLGRDKGGKPAIAKPGGALDRQVALAADPDVERPFSRARFESDVGELVEPPFVGDMRPSPELTQHLHAFFQAFSPFFWGNATGQTVSRVAAQTDRHDHPPAAAREVVEGCIGFRHLHRVTSRQGQDARPHLDRLGAGGEHRHDARDLQLRVTRDNVVGEPDGINAQGLGPFGIGADRVRARHAEPPQAKAHSDFGAAHARASLRQSGGTLPERVWVMKGSFTMFYSGHRKPQRGPCVSCSGELSRVWFSFLDVNFFLK